jgi:two-component system, chemotaxis family, sensor kinase CheA
MPRRDAELKERLLATFRVEADEHVEALLEHLAELADGGAPELLEVTFREMHTLKGASRSVGLRDVERVCAACEALLSTLTRAGAPPAPPLLALLEEAVSAVARLIADGGAPPGDLVQRLQSATADPTSAEPVAAPAPIPDLRAGTIRLGTAELDDLLRRGEDLLAIKLAADEWVADAAELLERLRRGRRASDPAAALRALEAPARAMLNGLLRDRRTIGAAIDGLLDETRRVRMTPASTILDVFPRMLRDLARSEGKDVEWEASGGALQVDRRVIEAIKDPLIHVMRNAVDHGIEPPEERLAAGKPARGRISAAVRPLEGGRLEVVITDDGRGIEPERVQAAAQRARIDSTDDPLALVFRSGLSTSFVITDVSGHGLGLAIVKEQVERLGGTVALESRPGAGTTVRMVVPETITTFRGLLVRASGQRFLLPLDALVRVVAAEPVTVHGREMIRVDGELIPCGALAAVLGIEADSSMLAERRAYAVVAAGQTRAALLVDEVVGDREVLVKELEPPLVRVRNVAAAGLLGGGELVLILRPVDLVGGVREQRGRAARGRPAKAPEGPSRVLVVDDAVTTRAMERGLLELAGYHVEVAVDGVEAWAALKTDRFDLVVSDVDMPRMDGFELTTRIRADRTLTDLPVILVSALEAREDKERGIEVGANAYVVKSSFEQSNLLEIIHRLGVRPAEVTRA